jgi:hypothetical protein
MKKELYNFIAKKIPKEDKAKKSIFQSILGIVYDLNIDEKIILDWIKDAENDNIFKTLNFINGGNWINEVKNKNYIPFMVELFECRPIGLGTPNAACGEGELMMILSSKKIFRPTKNDIKIDGQTFNLKNDEPRFFAEVTGKELNKKLIEICKKSGFTPNLFKGKEYVQILNKKFVEEHWNKQFEKTEISKVQELLMTFLFNLFPEKNIKKEDIKNIINNVIINNKLVWDLWVKEVIIFLFKNGNNKNENYVLMNVNGLVNKIPSDLNNFISLINDNKILFSQDYFRMFQDKKVGIYIKFVN